METDADKKLLELVHQSGFPFQIGVRKEIERTSGKHGWSISAEEHHWTHPVSGKTRFIDLVAQHNQYPYSLVVECKRVRAKDRRGTQGPSWIFLTPNGNATTQQRLSVYKAKKLRDFAEPSQKYDQWGWSNEAKLNPATIESAYCIFESQDEKSPMIERIADTLLPSVEAVAAEWITHTNTSNNEQHAFLPVIVTNATLYTCIFDAKQIDMSDGILPSSEIQPVPFIRFRKGLAQVTTGRSIRDFKDANLQQQRTLIIANAASLADTLSQLSIA